MRAGRFARRSPLNRLQICVACQQSRPSYAKARAYGAYQSELRDLIHLLKYEGVLPAARILGRMLAEAICKLDLPQKPTWFVPVPLHASKRWQRGFNRSETIARVALKKFGPANLQLAQNVLVRERATVSQIALTRPQRLQNIRGAFRVAHPSRKEDAILLVDDILTTGTTASECARVLRKARAKNVWVAPVARTLKESDAILQVEPEFEDAAQAS